MSQWRVGRKVFKTLYKDDELAGLLLTDELAREVAGLCNGAPADDPRTVTFAAGEPGVYNVMRAGTEELHARVKELEAQLSRVRLFAQVGATRYINGFRELAAYYEGRNNAPSLEEYSLVDGLYAAAAFLEKGEVIAPPENWRAECFEDS